MVPGGTPDHEDYRVELGVSGYFQVSQSVVQNPNSNSVCAEGWRNVTASF